ncbi:MAG: CbiX/SirB N-terminal domain-containing protein [Planctomycetota bacterium]
MLILVAHGSHDPRWRASMERVIESLQAEVGGGKVRLAYMECTPPTLADVASDAVLAGTTRIRVLPLFLTAEGHVDRDIRPLVAELRETHPHVDVEMLPPVGQHRLFRELLYKITVQTDQ